MSNPEFLYRTDEGCVYHDFDDFCESEGLSTEEGENQTLARYKLVDEGKFKFNIAFIPNKLKKK